MSVALICVNIQMNRRKYLTGLGATSSAALAGCLDGGESPADNQVEQLATPGLGDKSAPVTVMVFEDFRCPHCKDFNDQTAPQLIEEYVTPGEIRYEHHDFPVLGDLSVQAANAARSVQHHHGMASFWSYSELLFENQSAISLDLFKEAATEVGADPSVVATEAQNKRFLPVIEADRTLARNSGATGTPTVVVDGTKIESGDGYTRRIALAIEDALGR